MPISTISQTISTIPEAGHRGVDVQTTFVTKQEDFQDHLQGTTVSELNALKTQINTTVAGMNSAVTNVNTKANEADADALSASNSANTATTKAGEASTSASQASASATKASQWADNNYNVVVETGKYSAKHWATVAQNTVNNKVDKVTSTDNAVVRFNGTTGNVQNSGVVINDNGNIGIGATPSDWSSTSKSIDIKKGSFYSTGDFDIQIAQNSYLSPSNNWVYKTNGYASSYYQMNSSHTWRTAPSGIAGNNITWKDVMTLDTSDTLSVGYGSLLVNPLSENSDKAVVVYGANKSNNIQLVGRDIVGTAGVLRSYMEGVLKSAILANGNFQSATNSYGSTSDAKLKENVVDTSPKLDKLMQVQVRNFNYIGQEEKQIGVVAQEIEQIFPSIVYETRDTKQVEVEREKTLGDGRVEIEKHTETVETGETTKNVKYSVIYMMMLKGMQEMRAEYTNEIAGLKQEIEILKGAK